TPFKATGARSGGGPAVALMLATWASAWTPASVRPATARPVQPGKTWSSAVRSAPSTVRCPGWTAQPAKSVPSYSSVSLKVATPQSLRTPRRPRKRALLPRGGGGREHARHRLLLRERQGVFDRFRPRSGNCRAGGRGSDRGGPACPPRRPAAHRRRKRGNARLGNSRVRRLGRVRRRAA